ncbi:hypothetical protein NIES4071_33570 [Calothrix sp. NIES-4071]|nr:hypothetical protein NIES4071_33570 [Calothrix sp. NIES-4071]BAZ57676.1 hypothetical protein NIES4105_33500 [Calothrix sp. NIES-4105]
MPILPVSPLDLVSLERIARAIQWWLNGQRYQLYPHRLSANIPNFLLQNTGWLKKDIENNLFYVLRQPSLEETNNFKTNLESLIKQASARGSKAKGEISELQKIVDLPEQAERIIQPLKICPVCHAVGSFQSLNNQSFKCECSECKSIWGTRTCGHCNMRYPYIQMTSVEGKNGQPGWVERTLGRDVLAVPCWQHNNYESFICPNCGKCAQTQSSQHPTCVRCQSKT